MLASFNLVITWLLIPRVETKLFVFALARQFPANKMTQHFWKILEIFAIFHIFAKFDKGIFISTLFQPGFNSILN